jgi:nucleoside phosphorylase
MSTTPTVSEEIKKIFTVFDLDGDGYITIEEFTTILSRFSPDTSRDQILDLINLISRANVPIDDKIEIDEFTTLMNRLFKMGIRSHSDLRQLNIMREDQMKDLRTLLSHNQIINPDKKIEHVAIIVVVAEEIKPVLDNFKPVEDEEMNKEFMNLAKVWTCWVGDKDKYKLSILQVGTSSYYRRHNSGYSQVAAIGGLVAKILKPDILISFGTAGGIVGKVKIGDVVVGEGTIFVDRIRTSNKNSFDWGIYGGPSMRCSGSIGSHCNLARGIVGSQINYSVNEVQTELIKIINVVCLDMEAASLAGILQQVGINFLVVKAISNFVYPGEPHKMEDEYVQHKAEVSQASIIALSSLLNI